jgi:hypothetical protein
MAGPVGLAFLLLFSLTSCFHHSPDEAVLAPLSDEVGQARVDQGNQPEYLTFADELTARVFKNLRRDPHYRILPTGKPFVCPSDGTPCPHPYELRARVDAIMGDSAIATIQRIYPGGGGRGIAYSEQILLVHRNGKWKVETVLGYSAMPM